jgi:hypothetical protein
VQFVKASVFQRNEPQVTEVRPPQPTSQRSDEQQAIVTGFGEALQVPAQLADDIRHESNPTSLMVRRAHRCIGLDDNPSVRKNRSDQMTDSTSRWLAPIMAALGRSHDDIDVQALMDQATTVTKLDKPRTWWRLPPAGDEEGRSVDWIRFGQLLRDALGLDDYPEVPPKRH